MRVIKRNIQRKPGFWNGSIIVALVAAVAIFASMLQLEKKVLTQYEKGMIYVASREIPRGQLITPDNFELYMECRELDKNCIPPTALSSAEQIADMAALFEIEKGVLLTTGMFESLDKIKAEMKEPVIAGLKAEDLYQVVGGTLRTGDRIDIYKIDTESMSELVWKDVYVYEVFDNTGEVIPAGDITTATQRINIYLESAEVANFYTELSLGSLRAVKVCD